jgi:hypothetical protein
MDPINNLENFDGTFIRPSQDPVIRRENKIETVHLLLTFVPHLCIILIMCLFFVQVAQTVCDMVAFLCNCRHNGLQMSNSLIFLASGVTERVNTYLNYIGLSSSQRTAHSALASLGKGAHAKLMGCFDLALSPTLSLLVCFDNLDFQEKIHMKGIGHSSQMFHGTWGYIHSPPPSLLAKLDKDQLTIDAMNAALHDASKITIQPDMFTPTLESSAHFKLTIKSQITRATLRYYASPINSRIQLHKNPPEVQPIEPYDPQICMLKLMVAADNLAIGWVRATSSILFGNRESQPQTMNHPSTTFSQSQVLHTHTGMSCKPSF